MAVIPLLGALLTGGAGRGRDAAAFPPLGTLWPGGEGQAVVSLLGVLPPGGAGRGRCAAARRAVAW
ncbi:hypothetical protein GM655_11545 [Pseudoduganella danionis]|uniref:Uncharacterized protein n=1 Tax=Pseudoduganella danionis TaxID=1890295 RepID=A0ABW9SRY5_9BURK|nr:hypothetical protein [Pseudoduganella danionis]MTW33459.1 hypothetical protein [Pseudoduganella danionis]